MKKELVDTFNKFRLIGYPANRSLENAKVLVAFAKLEAEGKVRLRAEAEDEDYFSVYGEPDSEKEREAICRQINLNGIWWVVSEKVTCKKCGTFEVVDSIGMCIYANPLDPFENDYVIDLMRSCL